MIESEPILDQQQQEVWQTLEQIRSTIESESSTNMKFWQRITRNNRQGQNVYLHGSVGSGKTMLMSMFYDKLVVTKEIIHYQKFMHQVHTKLHTLYNKNNQAIEELACDIASAIKVLCIDELEIKDITDAMIIGRLFNNLIKHGISLFLTTNTAPDDLYKDGIQRESFLPFIDDIKKKFRVLALQSNCDYRYKDVANFNERIFYTFDERSKDKMQMVKQNLCHEEDRVQVTLKVFGHNILFKRVYQDVLLTDFTELFNRDLSYSDFIKITERFKIIIIEGIKKITPSETNTITRLINFVDNAYFNHRLLFIEMNCQLEEIYVSGPKVNEFKRTISRLTEMNSHKWASDYLLISPRNKGGGSQLNGTILCEKS